MLAPNFEYENKLINSGFLKICGIDEVGRGPLAGPVVAAAVIINEKLIGDEEKFKNIKDSKKLSAKQREKWREILIGTNEIKWGIGIVSEKIIDKINILEATKLAMLKAINDLICRTDSIAKRGEPDFLLIDGNFTLDIPDLNQKAVPQGDSKIISIAAASIVAKAARDRIMIQYHKKYPQYGFEKHKGYGTAMHIEMIKKYGPCAIHRRSFEPIKGMAKFI